MTALLPLRHQGAAAQLPSPADTPSPGRTGTARRIMGSIARWLVRGLIGLAVITFLGLVVGPYVFGYRTMTMLTGSMAPEIEPGDVTVVTPIATSDVTKGMVIAYHRPIEDHSLVTHRVVSVTTSPDGTVTVQTKGDANDAVDPWTASLKGDTAYQVRAVIPELGHLIQALRTPVLNQALLYGAPALLVGWALLSIWRPTEDETREDDADRAEDTVPAPLRPSDEGAPAVEKKPRAKRTAPQGARPAAAKTTRPAKPATTTPAKPAAKPAAKRAAVKAAQPAVKPVAAKAAAIKPVTPKAAAVKPVAPKAAAVKPVAPTAKPAAKRAAAKPAQPATKPAAAKAAAIKPAQPAAKPVAAKPVVAKATAIKPSQPAVKAVAPPVKPAARRAAGKPAQPAVKPESVTPAQRVANPAAVVSIPPARQGGVTIIPPFTPAAVKPTRPAAKKAAVPKPTQRVGRAVSPEVKA